MLFSLSKAARLLCEDSLRLLSRDSHVSISPYTHIPTAAEVALDTST